MLEPKFCAWHTFSYIWPFCKVWSNSFQYVSSLYTKIWLTLTLDIGSQILQVRQCYHVSQYFIMCYLSVKFGKICFCIFKSTDDMNWSLNPDCNPNLVCDKPALCLTFHEVLWNLPRQVFSIWTEITWLLTPGCNFDLRCGNLCYAHGIFSHFFIFLWSFMKLALLLFWVTANTCFELWPKIVALSLGFGNINIVCVIPSHCGLPFF